MVNTRGARPSIDGQDPSDVPPSPSAAVDDKGESCPVAAPSYAQIYFNLENQTR